MRCPFLQEVSVSFCGASPFRKMLQNAARFSNGEKCTSRQFTTCALAAGRRETLPDAASCPFFCESLVQFCSAAPATRFIPYSQTLLSCCQSEGHRYCDLFLNEAEPERGGRPQEDQVREGPARVDGIEVPTHLAFAANHLWLDISEDGSCHVGADAFLARVVGRVDRVVFIAGAEVGRPTAVLRVYGVDLTLVFPGRVTAARPNVHLRRDPDRVVSDPYGRGWLFEGRVPTGSATEPAGVAHLRRGEEALAWMKTEADRMTRFVHEVVSLVGPGGRRLLNDGGEYSPPIVPHLAPEDQMILFNTFFSLDRTWRSQ